ncbi:FAD-dependent oxidoreductase [Herbaspirillum sp. RTI4]|uniref:FAD-dependent oxidoreductase n=1 Tax=Herbaspirillum sp. RTI4 TaxID=3048640 RepID=UPI002AB49873|nr:FAD-dependent oxidoreductase [Herbaspirillum sp. RTI4]MDY7579020.1 FAD-dependent oxidoreductase [Herbaspirillum sp. RTI4]MEA9980951.1 FAD-dependent oxidoreductase [Herbaspirillum sp. RTI4]
MAVRPSADGVGRRIAIIGGGLGGVCSAYFLARDGHEVTVIERRNNVAEEATLGNSGLIAPGASIPLATPDMARQTFYSRFRAEAPLLMPRGIDPALWRWLRQWRLECQLEHHLNNKERSTRLAAYGQKMIHQLQQRYALEHENNAGVVRMFRTTRELELALAQQEVLMRHDIPHSPLSAAQMEWFDPALAGGMLFAGDESGNCVLFAKQLKTAAQALGVQFHFGKSVSALRTESNGVRLEIAGSNTAFSADAVVLSAGMESATLLKPLGIHLPLYPVQSYSGLVNIKNPEFAPKHALIDDHYRVSIAAIGNRIRIAGVAGFVSHSSEIHKKALRTMLKVAQDYFPDAANYNTAQFWSNSFASTPHGLPLLGPTALTGVYLNLGHGANGWASTLGGARLVADCISRKDFDINAEDLMAARLSLNPR